MYWSMKTTSSMLAKLLAKILANNWSLAGLLAQGISLALSKIIALVIA
jgi:hypothetical protein